MLISNENIGIRIIIDLESDNQLNKLASLEIHCKYKQILRITKKMI